MGGGLHADEFAAHFVVRSALTLDHNDVPSGPRKMRRKCAARDTAADDQSVSHLVTHVENRDMRRITPSR
jgi:hypothetical protein